MSAADERRVRLSRAMDERRRNLALSWKRVADRAGMTETHLRRIRNGEVPLTDNAKAAIERALEWAQGTVDRYLSGADPDATESNLVPARRDGRIELPLPDGDDRYHLVGVINEGLPGLPMARLREIAVLVRAMHEDQHPDDL